MGSEPEEQSEDSLRIYKFAIDIARGRYGGVGGGGGEALV
jgi:hypothetical protein